MKKYTKIVLLFVLTISLTFCAMKNELQSEFPQEIQSVFYQKVENGKEKGAIHFYIEFKKPIATTIKLDKIYFHNESATVEEISKNTFIAKFNDNSNNEDLILDSNPTKEYGNKPPVLIKSTFDLKPSEAVLEYASNNKAQCFKITGVLERVVR